MLTALHQQNDDNHSGDDDEEGEGADNTDDNVGHRSLASLVLRIEAIGRGRLGTSGSGKHPWEDGGASFHVRI